MRKQMQLRLEELKKEFEVGQQRLKEVEKQQVMLRETLLRISGAIQLLEEMLEATIEPQEVATNNLITG